MLRFAFHPAQAFSEKSSDTRPHDIVVLCQRNLLSANVDALGAYPTVIVDLLAHDAGKNAYFSS